MFGLELLLIPLVIALTAPVVVGVTAPIVALSPLVPMVII